jgi:hypothetical protein
MNPDLSMLPAGALVVLGVVLVIEITLDVIALVDLYRRPLDRVALGNKWVWVAIILLVNLVGAILYLAIGRKPAGPSQDAEASRPSSASDVADKLYGPRDDSIDP